MPEREVEIWEYDGKKKNFLPDFFPNFNAYTENIRGKICDSTEIIAKVKISDYKIVVRIICGNREDFFLIFIQEIGERELIFEKEKKYNKKEPKKRRQKIRKREQQKRKSLKQDKKKKRSF